MMSTKTTEIQTCYKQSTGDTLIAVNMRVLQDTIHPPDVYNPLLVGLPVELE